MLTFKQFINENLESYLKRYPPYNSELSFEDSDYFSYTFDTDSDISYEVIFRFERVKLYPKNDYWTIEFKRTSPGAGDDYSKTGYGIIPTNDQVESIRIFTTVIGLIIEQDKKFQGRNFIYRMTAEEKSRIKLYDTFLPMLANEIDRVCYKYTLTLKTIYNLMEKEKETEWLNSMTKYFVVNKL